IAISGPEWVSYQNAIASITAISSTVTTQGNAIAALNATTLSQGASITTLDNAVAGNTAAINTLNSNYAATQTALAALQGNYATVLTYQTAPFDLTYALAAFTFFFSTVIIFFWISQASGAVIQKIRRPLGHG